MDGIMLKYDGESGTWKKAKAPYMSIDIPTEEDFEELNKALQAYYDNTAHLTKDHDCSECGCPIGYETGLGEIIPIEDVKYCYHCGRRFVEEEE